MKVTCNNCHTGYDLPAGKEGVLGCPYCEHINVPKQTSTPAPTQIPRDEALDSSKTMLGPMDGRLEKEGVLKSGDALEIGTTMLRFTLKPRP